MGEYKKAVKPRAPGGFNPPESAPSRNQRQEDQTTWNHFEFANGSNPYITKNNKAFFEMLCKYNLTQIDCNCFKVDAERPSFKRTYNNLKEIVREFAIDWQCSFSDMVYSWGELADWQDFFSEYGRKYGLLREFHENAIC